MIVAVVSPGTPIGCSPVATLTARLMLVPDKLIIEQRPDPVYEELFPAMSNCARSASGRSTCRAKGNAFGHAAIYPKGACMDADAPSPQLRRCERTATTADDPEHGVGVSDGRFSINVNWIAIPGYELLHEGLLAPAERLTQDAFDATARHAIDIGMFEGSELQDGWSDDPAATLAHYIAAHSAGTDFALRYARNVLCARVPVGGTILREYRLPEREETRIRDRQSEI